MNLTSHIMSLQATNLMHNAQQTMFGANRKRMELAGGVTGTESMQDIARLAQVDKAIMLQGLQAQIRFQAAQAMMETAARLRESDKKLDERLRAAGAIFV